MRQVLKRLVRHDISGFHVNVLRLPIRVLETELSVAEERAHEFRVRVHHRFLAGP